MNDNFRTKRGKGKNYYNKWVTGLFNERAFSQYGKEKMRGKRYTKNENSGLNITLSVK